MGVKDKRENPESNFVDYDMAVVFCPMLLVGTKIGTIANKIFSSMFLTFVLMIFFVYSIFKTYKNAMTQYNKEKLLATFEPENSYNLGPKYILLDDKLVKKSKSSFEIHKGAGKRVESSDSKNDSNTEKTEEETIMDLSGINKKIMDEENQPIRWNRVKILGIFFLVILADQLIEGNHKLPSFLGIRR